MMKEWGDPLFCLYYEVKRLAARKKSGNTAQIVWKLAEPIAQELGLTEEQAYQLGSCFGSGMLHGATCGALSAALMVAGMKGCDTQQATALIHQFREDRQATDCAALLAQAREGNIPKKDHCDGLVLDMVAKLDELLTDRS